MNGGPTMEAMTTLTLEGLLMAMLSRPAQERRRFEIGTTLDLYATYSYLLSNSSGCSEPEGPVSSLLCVDWQHATIRNFHLDFRLSGSIHSVA
jgi:hypothetical protein